MGVAVCALLITAVSSGVTGTPMREDILLTTTATPLGEEYKCGINTEQIEVMAGEEDNFDATPDTPAADPSQALVDFVESNGQTVVGFDYPIIDKHFIHTFQWDCNPIIKAWLEVKIKLLGGQPDTDGLNLRFSVDDYDGINYQIWDESDTTGQTMTIVLDLGGLPAEGTLLTDTSSPLYPTVSLLTELNETGYLDLHIQDDTSVDYAKLILCCKTTRACLYSGSKTMEMLTTPDQWDVNNPPENNWTAINVIPNHDADSSEYGNRYPDLPWSFMYLDGAHWVHGTVDWESPSSGHEYYRIPLILPVDNCVNLHFKAYVDDAAKFYIAGPGDTTPTLFYTYPAFRSMYEHDPAEFTIDIDGQRGADCLQPGDYTIYIDHWDTEGVLYSLIFTAECVSCQCDEPGPCLGTTLLAAIVVLGIVLARKH